MGAERIPGGASLEQAEVVRSRLASFEWSLRALRTPSRELRADGQTTFILAAGAMRLVLVVRAVL
jgi:hypothetical protein